VVITGKEPSRRCPPRPAVLPVATRRCRRPGAAAAALRAGWLALSYSSSSRSGEAALFIIRSSKAPVWIICPQLLVFTLSSRQGGTAHAGCLSDSPAWCRYQRVSCWVSGTLRRAAQAYRAQRPLWETAVISFPDRERLRVHHVVRLQAFLVLPLLTRFLDPKWPFQPW